MISLTLTEAEQDLLLANEYNDVAAWQDIARKIRTARVTNGVHVLCKCCIDNECECEGRRLMPATD
jgi:hypothetical protein